MTVISIAFELHDSRVKLITDAEGTRGGCDLKTYAFVATTLLLSLSSVAPFLPVFLRSNLRREIDMISCKV